LHYSIVVRMPKQGGRLAGISEKILQQTPFFQ